MKKCNVKNTGKVIRNIIDNGYPGDLDFCRVDLTRDDSGNYYLDCEGGARSAFGVYLGYPSHSWTSGARVYRVETDDDKRRVNRACYLIENRARIEEEKECSIAFSVYEVLLRDDLDKDRFNWEYYFGAVNVPSVF